MKVRDLVERLAVMDPDWDVVVRPDENSTNVYSVWHVGTAYVITQYGLDKHVKQDPNSVWTVVLEI